MRSEHGFDVAAGTADYSGILQERSAWKHPPLTRSTNVDVTLSSDYLFKMEIRYPHSCIVVTSCRLLRTSK